MLSVVKNSIVFLVIVIFSGCNKYHADKYYNSQGKDSLLVKILPYVAKLPYSATWDDRMDEKFHSHYVKILPFFSIQKIYITEDSTYYYLIWKQAPSIEAKERIAVGGSFKISADKSIIDFNEIFHTQKMIPDKLSDIGDSLFDEMVKSGNIDKYLGSPEIIDFPNQQFVYDKNSNKWVARIK